MCSRPLEELSKIFTTINAKLTQEYANITYRVVSCVRSSNLFQMSCPLTENLLTSTNSKTNICRNIFEDFDKRQFVQ